MMSEFLLILNWNNGEYYIYKKNLTVRSNIQVMTSARCLFKMKIMYSPPFVESLYPIFVAEFRDYCDDGLHARP